MKWVPEFYPPINEASIEELIQQLGGKSDRLLNQNTSESKEVSGVGTQQ